MYRPLFQSRGAASFSYMLACMPDRSPLHSTLHVTSGIIRMIAIDYTPEVPPTNSSGSLPLTKVPVLGTPEGLPRGLIASMYY
jgi:hypothetical protein